MFTACGNSNTPLDADIRQQIDSITGAQTRLAQKEIDSLCKEGRVTLLPHLVDSIKAVRKQEVEEQLRTIPRQ